MYLQVAGREDVGEAYLSEPGSVVSSQDSDRGAENGSSAACGALLVADECERMVVDAAQPLLLPTS